MSGRVRWERVRVAPWARVLRVDDRRVGSIDRMGGVWVAWLSGVGEHVTLRRSDATRWLLARAAGLAEVPRARRLPRDGMEDGDARRPPSGWRHLTTVEICGETVSAYQRNRRRR